MRNNSSEQYTFQTQMHEVVEVEKIVGTTDHALLTNRDAPDQHPISAIIGLQEILDELRNGLKPSEPEEVEKNPVITEPKVVLELSGGDTTACEVGETITMVYNVSLDPGSYEYGPETGIVPTSWKVTDTDGNEASSEFGSLAAITVTDAKTYAITATATHGDGTMPLTSLGNEYPAGQIKAGTKSTTVEKTIAGFRKSFYGTTTDKEEITSDVIRGLTGSSDAALENDTELEITIPVGAMRVIIAYPATLQDLSSVKDDNGMSAQIVSSFKQQIIPVEGANGYEAIDYKVYVLNYALANDIKNIYKVII